MSIVHLPVVWPSGCGTYIDAVPEDIMVRPYTGEDESILAQINPTNIEKNFLIILKRVVSGIDPTKLTLGDRMYLMIWEYINSYSETLRVRQVCSNCLKEAEFTIDLRNLSIKGLDPDLSIPTDVQLPISGETVHLRPLTVGDEVAVEKLRSSGTDIHLYRYARSFVGGADPVKQMEEMRTWPARDVARIRYYHDVEADHGPIMNVEQSCPECGGEEEVIIPFRFGFFYPEGETLRDCFRA
jgi:hypothetical protein